MDPLPTASTMASKPEDGNAKSDMSHIRNLIDLTTYPPEQPDPDRKIALALQAQFDAEGSESSHTATSGTSDPQEEVVAQDDDDSEDDRLGEEHDQGYDSDGLNEDDPDYIALKLQDQSDIDEEMDKYFSGEPTSLPRRDPPNANKSLPIDREVIDLTISEPSTAESRRLSSDQGDAAYTADDGESQLFQALAVPSAVQEDILRKHAQDLLSLHCESCLKVPRGAKFDPNVDVVRWLEEGTPNGLIHCCECEALICGGCGTASSRQKGKAKQEARDLTWHCDDGRLFAILAFLIYYEKHRVMASLERDSRAERQTNLKRKQSVDHNNREKSSRHLSDLDFEVPWTPHDVHFEMMDIEDLRLSFGTYMDMMQSVHQKGKLHGLKSDIEKMRDSLQPAPGVKPNNAELQTLGSALSALKAGPQNSSAHKASLQSLSEKIRDYLQAAPGVKSTNTDLKSLGAISELEAGSQNPQSHKVLFDEWRESLGVDKGVYPSIKSTSAANSQGADHADTTPGHLHNPLSAMSKLSTNALTAPTIPSLPFQQHVDVNHRAEVRDKRQSKTGSSSDLPQTLPKPKAKAKAPSFPKNPEELHKHILGSSHGFFSHSPVTSGDPNTYNSHSPVSDGEAIGYYPPPPSARARPSNGTGYGGCESEMSRHNRSRRQKRLSGVLDTQIERSDDETMGKVLGVLTMVLPNMRHETVFDMDPPKSLVPMLAVCSLVHTTAELLRNDSIGDIANRPTLYHRVLDFVELLAKHYVLSDIVSSGRKIYALGLRSFCSTDTEHKHPGETVTSIQACMKNLATQARAIVQRAAISNGAFQEDDAQDMLLLCTRIVEVADVVSTWAFSAVPRKPKKLSLTPQDQWTEFHQQNCISDVDDDLVLKGHVFKDQALRLKSSRTGRMKRLVEETVTLQTSLPQGIFVRYATSRPDVLKVLIIGPSDTPYDGGLFEFDVYCPEDYPASPPIFQFRTTGGGRAGFNPNLYPCGKVCLSLLNTWSGQPWEPHKSTLLQVLVSLQSMVFCEKPWYNEPGREISRLGRGGDNPASERYDQSVQLLTVQHAVIGWLAADKRGELGIWKDIVQTYFGLLGPAVVKTVEKWATENHYIGWKMAVQVSQRVAGKWKGEGPT